MDNVKEKWKKLFAHKDVKPILDKCLAKVENNDLLRPKYDEIFKAFTYFDIDELKVIIIGQDPYPKIEDACGLSFALRGGVTKHSLAAIYECLSVSGFSNCDINEWPKQGVLLLNRYLTRTATVEEGVVNNGGSDKEHMHTFWGEFTNVIIRKIVNYKNRHNEKIAIMMWGDKAKIDNLNDKSLNLYWGHPSKLSNYNKTDNPKNFKYCDHFTITHQLYNIKWGTFLGSQQTQKHKNTKEPESVQDVKDVKELKKETIVPPSGGQISEEVGASAERVVSREAAKRATPRGQQGREASDAKITVFTDGGCSNNGKKNAVATYGVYFPDMFMDEENAIKGKFGGKVPTPPVATNNRGEMLAMITALEKIVESGLQLPILLITDSTYCMKTVTQWLPKWFKKNPKFSDRPNSDLLLRIMDNLTKLEQLHNAKHPTFLTIQHQNSHQKAPPKDPKVKTGGHAYESHLGNSIVDDICSSNL